MQFTSLLLAMAASLVAASPLPAAAEGATLVAASPLPAAAEGATLESRAVTHVYMCYNENFTGACYNMAVNTGSCNNLDNNWNDVVSSIGPDSGTRCDLFVDHNCQGRSLQGIFSPGIFKLADYSFNDVLSSVRCY